MRFYLLLLILFIPTAAAMNNIFDIMDEKYITHISEMPYSSGNPTIEWQNQGHIWAWIDIVGFRNTTKKNGKYFINAAPEQLAITQYDATYIVPGTVDSITKTCTYSISGNNLIANLVVVLKWHVTCCDDDGCWTCGRYEETKTFQDIEIQPEQQTKEKHAVRVTEYNNSVNPRAEIKVSSSADTINYIYNGHLIKNYKSIAHVETTPKGIYFANISPANIWTSGTGALRQTHDKVIIPGTADPDYENLIIQTSSLYETETITISKQEAVRETYSFNRSFSGLYISILMISSIMLGTLYYTAKRAL